MCPGGFSVLVLLLVSAVVGRFCASCLFCTPSICKSSNDVSGSVRASVMGSGFESLLVLVDCLPPGGGFGDCDDVDLLRTGSLVVLGRKGESAASVERA